MSLLDVGCGPGSITVGLAAAVAPGGVIGLDHDAAHIEAARSFALERGVTNATFELGSALELPVADGSVDAVFENDLLVHLADDAPAAAREVHRVLKPGGFFAARDADADAVLWGHRTDALRRFDELFYPWQRSRGSEITLGKRLPAILQGAGFAGTVTTISADTKGTPEEVREQARIMTFLLDGPVGRYAVENGKVAPSELDELRRGISAWGEQPDAFFANVHVEVIGWKRP